MKLVSIATLGLSVVIAAVGLAQVPPAATPAAPAPAAPSCIAPRAAVDFVATTLAIEMGKAPAGVVVAVGPLASDVEAPRADALVALLARQVAGRLGSSAKALEAAMTLAEARVASRGAGGLVYLAPQIAGGRLAVTADGYPIARTVWALARASEPGPVTHGFAAAPLDAEVRTFLKPIPFAQPTVAKFDGADPEILAMACGDVDDDGGVDLYTVTRARVLQVRLADARVERVREAAWGELLPIAAVPFRQPIATAIVSGGHLDVGLTDREGSVRLDAALRRVAVLPGLTVSAPEGSACAPRGDAMIAPGRRACAEGDPTPSTTDVGRVADAMASSLLVTSGGAVKPLVALRREDAAVVIRDGNVETVLGRAGAQLAIADIDQDGAIDVVTTMDVLGPAYDALAVRTLLPSGTVAPRYHLPVTTGVDAVTVCPPDGGNRAPIVIATGGQLWVVR